ncbi:hypothetical protein F3Y22_tig00111621pilonHSYRG00473 [Hibiscus syriacus]|uniref:Uncharacterized protein n=1 Tax=Hibiscus syriacus TaxID=106335 RepID=A0A6A2YIH7_HIBSY|nr:hypothetical protein F3Y22_tig00111621pilonHSYRG00473 [Hibiscus syriacus]
MHTMVDIDMDMTTNLVEVINSTLKGKVADRIVKLFAIDPEGQKREVVGLAGQTLLRALTNCGLIDPASHRLEEIDACSAECEVNIAQEWLERLPPRTYDEEYVLVRNSRGRILNKHSSLDVSRAYASAPRYGRAVPSRSPGISHNYYRENQDE